MMRKFGIPVLALMTSFLLFAAGCTCGGDDDDDNDNGLPQVDDDTADDDTATTDDDADDTTDDDTADDDTADDTVDDDTADDTDDDDTVDDDTGVLVDIDFDGYALGPLGLPWIVDPNGTSTASIEQVAKSASGHMLHIHGGTTTSDFLTAGYSFGPADFAINVSFDYSYEAGASGGFALAQAGTDVAEIIARMGAGDVIWSNMLTCATLTPSIWSKITFAIDFAGGTFAILVDDVPTPCTDVSLGGHDGTPLGWIYFADEHVAGLGGEVYFDNLLVTVAP